MVEAENEIVLRARRAGSTGVQRQGNVVLRPAAPWTPTVHSLLRHLEEDGFSGAPCVVGSGFAPDGRETLSYIEGGFTHPGPWTIECAAGVGRLLRQLHEATASYRPPPDAVWPPWFGRCLGGPNRTIGHCDVAGLEYRDARRAPVALIDWKTAGPVDPMIELAQAAGSTPSCSATMSRSGRVCHLWRSAPASFALSLTPMGCRPRNGAVSSI